MEHKHQLPTGRVERLKRARQGPRLRHVGRSGDGQAQGRAWRDDLLFLLRRLPREVRRRARALSWRPQPGRRRRTPAPSGAIYTCPMHPQIRQAGPGNCPICGMALEPETVTADYGPQRRTDRHDAALLDRLGSRGPGGRARNGRPSHQSAYVAFARRLELDSSSCSRRRSCCGRAGRSSSGHGRRSRTAVSTCSR